MFTGAGLQAFEPSVIIPAVSSPEHGRSARHDRKVAICRRAAPMAVHPEDHRVHEPVMPLVPGGEALPRGTRAAPTARWTSSATSAGRQEMVRMTGQYGVPVIRVGERRDDRLGQGASSSGCSQGRAAGGGSTSRAGDALRRVDELREALDEHERDRVGRPVAVLGDDDLGHALLRPALLVLATRDRCCGR